MHAMILEKIHDLSRKRTPLKLAKIPDPIAKAGEVCIKISVCGVCHTELDEIEGRTPPPAFPVILGHQAVGVVQEIGAGVTSRKKGDRVGVAWIYSSCGNCSFCENGQENLCPDFKATGRDKSGGYAEYMSVPADFTYLIPEVFTDSEAAPLLCAGAIGFRSLTLTRLNDGQNLGLTGFGASAHLVLMITKYKFPSAKIYVFARSKSEQRFAYELGADWAGDTTDSPPHLLDAIIDTTPVWKPLIEALQRLQPNGRLVINAIRKEESDKNRLLELDYSRHLWLEKEIKSVANVTRLDVQGFLDLASRIPIKPEFQEYPLQEANRALMELKERKIRGAKVLRIT
jgi:propanol-preferring alcohol dehydrogenase